MNYQPPYTITPNILNRVAAISEAIGRLTALLDQAKALRLRRISRVRTIHGSLAIEGNTLSEAQITAILEGKRVIAPPREVQEVKNALAAYDRYSVWQPARENDLLEAHRILMSGLIEEAGAYRHGGVGVMAGQEVIHMAPPASRVPHLMEDLFGWLANTDAHPLIASSVFHYEFEFIHPFADGNGRMGRLWQSLILTRWNPLFADVPVDSLTFQHQAEYYQALQESTQQSDSAPFIAFILQMILDTLTSSSVQVSEELGVESEMALNIMSLLKDEALSKAELAKALGKSKPTRYLDELMKKTLESGQVAYTLPAKPHSRLQKYCLTEKGRALLSK